MRLVLAVLLSLVALPAMADTKVFNDIAYGRDDQQKLDVFMPDVCQNASCPVVIWVHGGGWRMGSKDMRNSRELMQTWAAQGIVTVSTNYRLSPQDVHPAHIRDVTAAIGWVYRHASQYGGNANRIFLLGHSAGAHLVALAGTSPTYLAEQGLKPSMLKGVFPIDTASFDLAANPNRHVQRMIRSAFGTDPAVLREASPIWNVSAGQSYPPFIIAATENRPDAVETSQILQSKLRSVGGQAELMVINYPDERQLAAHRDIAQDLRNINSPMTQKLLAFVKSH